MIMHTGSLIVFEGPDNSGKSIQLDLVAKKLHNIFNERENRRITTYCTKFPRYGSLYGQLINHMMYHKEEYDLLQNPSDMDLYSDLQMKDKLEGVQPIFQMLKNTDFVFCDRYTLSSRIYDAVPRLLMGRGIDPEDIKHWKANYSNGNRFYKNKHQMIKLYNLINSWVFNILYFEESINRQFKLYYDTLEHKYFNITHVLFRSCKTLERITAERRKVDQYEEESLFKSFVNIIYDNIPDAIEYYRETKIHPRFIDIPYIVSDLSLLLSKELKISLSEWNDGSKELKHYQELMYKYCTVNANKTVEIVTNDIAEKLYTSLKKQDNYISSPVEVLS
jgi:thymidylate kinase